MRQAKWMAAALAMGLTLASCANTARRGSFVLPAQTLQLAWASVDARGAMEDARDGTETVLLPTPHFSDAACHWTEPHAEARCRFRMKRAFTAPGVVQRQEDWTPVEAVLGKSRNGWRVVDDGWLESFALPADALLSAWIEVDMRAAREAAELGASDPILPAVPRRLSTARCRWVVREHEALCHYRMLVGLRPNRDAIPEERWPKSWAFLSRVGNDWTLGY